MGTEANKVPSPSPPAKKGAHDTLKVSGKRPFKSTTVDAKLQRERSMTPCDWKMLAFVMVVACAVRLYGLDWPTSVVFDEVHFGKFAKKYIIGRFFFDVHPPLAKMLYAVVAFLGGFDGDTDFDFTNIGDDYIADKIPYVAMRLFPSITGLITIALCYATMRASGVRTSISGFTALLLTFENTFATESRYILLDSPLVCFEALTVYAFKKYENYVPFTMNWYRYLLLTGLALGATMSSKWVGLFTFGWVGVLTVYQLWFILGDLNVSVRQFQNHFFSRLALLLFVPAIFYISMFWVHFMAVDNMGDGANMLPRWFQASLKHNELPHNVPLNVTFGSQVSLRHVATGGGWLHTHEHNYPEGSKQQQVTLYPYEDSNNLWSIESTDPANASIGLEIYDNTMIRLNAPLYKRRLHSHDHSAPLTSQEHYKEVSAYGFDGFDGDWNDNWIVKIVKSESVGTDAKNKLQALRTTFQLKHAGMGCYLHSKDITLPEWGYGQKEVTCLRDGKGPRTYWTIEHNISPHTPDVELVNYPVPSFFKKFVALNKLMWDVNKGLTAPHEWESRPLSWIRLKRGINMWGGHKRHVYLTGNLPVYWVVLASAILFTIYKVARFAVWYVFDLVPFFPGTNSALGLFEHNFGAFLLGWWFHLFPSFFMDRQLFLHHYMGSLYFGVLMIGTLFEYLNSIVKPKLTIRAVTLGFLTVSIGWYLWYSPLIYGTAWTKDLCKRSRYGDMDFTCAIYADNLSEYKAVNDEVASSKHSAYLHLNKPTESGVNKSFEGNAADKVKEPQQVQAQAQEERPTIRAYVNDKGEIERLDGADDDVDLASVQNEVNLQLAKNKQNEINEAILNGNAQPAQEDAQQNVQQDSQQNVQQDAQEEELLDEEEIQFREDLKRYEAELREQDRIKAELAQQKKEQEEKSTEEYVFDPADFEGIEFDTYPGQEKEQGSVDEENLAQAEVVDDEAEQVHEEPVYEEPVHGDTHQEGVHHEEHHEEPVHEDAHHEIHQRDDHHEEPPQEHQPDTYEDSNSNSNSDSDSEESEDSEGQEYYDDNTYDEAQASLDAQYSSEVAEANRMFESMQAESSRLDLLEEQMERGLDEGYDFEDEDDDDE